MKHQGKPALASTAQRFEPSGDMGDAGALVAQGAALQRTQTQFQQAIAVQRPRDIEQVAHRVLKEARMAGEDFYYAWSQKDKSSATGTSLIEGVSIDGAMILARNYGNCAATIEIVRDEPKAWVFSASFIDFETGFTDTRLFRQRKSEAHSRADAERLQDIAFQIGQSKAKRNVIVRCVPTYIVNRAMAEAKATVVARFKDVKVEAPKIVQKFSRIATQEQLERKIGKPFTRWASADLAMLDAIGRAIRAGQTTAELEFSEEAAQAKPEATEQAQASDDSAGATEQTADGESYDRDTGEIVDTSGETKSEA